jgi:hypothetical protein
MGKMKAIGAIVISQAQRCCKKGELTPFLANGSKINRRLIMVSHTGVDKC